MANNQIVYTGEKFKEFLSKNRITYQEASETLGIDKNTIGKAVRGGNLNTAILLKICNKYNFELSDFFSLIDEYGNEVVESKIVNYSEICDLNYASVAEDDIEYGSITNDELVEILKRVISSKDSEINALQDVVTILRDRLLNIEKSLLNK